jgi:hypothetical protein
MSDLTPRRAGGVSRQKREQRAYRLVLVTGGLAVAAVVVFVLAIINVASFGLFVLLVILAAIAGYLLKRTLNP